MLSVMIVIEHCSSFLVGKNTCMPACLLATDSMQTPEHAQDAIQTIEHQPSSDRVREVDRGATAMHAQITTLHLHVAGMRDLTASEWDTVMAMPARNKNSDK
jgi:hypothetical protein